MPASLTHTGQADFPHPALGQDSRLRVQHLLQLLTFIGVDRFPNLQVLTTYCICLDWVHWDRNRARPAVGEGFALLFRLQDGFTVPWLRFPKAPL